MSRHDDLNLLIDVRRLDYDYDEKPVTPTRTINVIDQYEQHHTGARGPASLSFAHKRRWILAIERMHEMEKNWSDVFYHIFIFADGEVWEGRDVLRTSQGNIGRAITVHLPGNNPVITEAQYLACLAIARWATNRPANVRDHQQRPAATYCSGDNGRNNIKRLRQELNMPLTDLLPEDLTNNADWTTAEEHGWISGNGQRVASRSVVGVVVTRAYRQTVKAVNVVGGRVTRNTAAISATEAKLASQAQRISQLTTSVSQLSTKVAALEGRTTTAIDNEAIVAAVVEELTD